MIYFIHGSIYISNMTIMKQKYFADHVHPNDAGHAVVAHMLQRFLENM